MTGAFKQADPSIICVSKILEQGLFKLPQLLKISPTPSFTTI
jgi:hypothetical protein